MPSNLFVKVFLGFWLVTLCIAAGWRLTGEYLDDLPRPPGHGAAPGHPEGPPPRFLLRLFYSVQTLPADELPPLITRLEQNHDITVYLFDRRGQELQGRDAPADVREFTTRLQGPRRRAFASERGRHMVAHEVYRAEQGVIRTVVVFPPHEHRLLGLLIDNRWLRLGLALLISGLLCYGLSRLLTRRLEKLQSAAGQIAAGDLDARLEVRERGGDETDQLARDFNSMAEQLQSRMEAQKRLLSDVSHELRSPLARLRVALALAQDAPDKHSEHLARMERETGRLEELIQELLNAQQDALVLDRHVDLVAMLEQLCEDARFEGEQRDLRVSLACAVDEAVVPSSADLLRRALENVLRNALRHSPDGGEVSVRLSPQGKGFGIEIRDRGPGLPEAELSRIFEPFYRADEARTPGDSGYGLGLAIARRALRLHGGEISARNTFPGLCVTITLPTDRWQSP
jgi:two-component system sensor histidine kinase CpxA